MVDISDDETPPIATEKMERYLLPKAYKNTFDHDSSITRFKYLLGLTDLFRHFIDLRAQDSTEIKQILEELDRKDIEEVPKGRAKTKKSAGSSGASSKTGRGRRKTEKEEDAELLNDEEKEDEAATTVFTESPRYVNGTLREYQIQGLNWLISLHENSISGILADEMGLGKTLQTISFLGYLRYVKNVEGPHIVIVPKSTLDNWDREFKKWTPEVSTLILQGDKDSRAQLVRDRLLTCDFDVLITSYEMVLREKSQLKKFAWQYIVVDEAHRIKNEDSMLSQMIRVFYSKNRLLITGTPLQNNLHELWALLNFLLPDVFADSGVFDQWFESQDNDQDMVVQQLHKVLSPFLLRRVKSDVEKSLLPKKESNVYVGMTEMQIKWYRRLLEKDIDAVNGAVGKREGKTRLLNIVMQLRKCCNHPYLFEGAEPGPPFTTDEHLINNSGKMLILDKLLARLKAQGSRVLIFSQMSRMLDILEDYCVFRGYEHSRIDGSTNHEDRISAIDEYNKPDSEKFVFLLTTRAGGLGINLTSADVVILYDSDWNPQADLQAMDRAHRIGQTKQVLVFRFITDNAIEEKVLERAAQKLRLDQLVIQQGRASKEAKNSSTSKDELLRMIQHGAEAMFQSEAKGGTMTDDSIDAILQQGEERTKQLNAKYSQLGLDDLQKFTSDHSAYEWNGEDFAKRNKMRPGMSWINPAKRERKEQTYSVDGYYREFFQSSKASAAAMRLPRPPKQVPLLEHQFFHPRLFEFQDKEINYYRKQVGFRYSIADVQSIMTDADTETKEERRKRLNQAIDEAQPLTEEEETEKAVLLQSAFVNWTKRDFTHFVHLAAKHGRDNFEAIAKGFPGKTAADIESYSAVFWPRHKEIQGWDRYVSQIEAGEEKLRTMQHQQNLLHLKIQKYNAPMSELVITGLNPATKKLYSEDEDRFLLLQMHDLGLDADNLYEKIRDRIKKSPLFRFDWFFLSRTAVELSRRGTTLLLAITREFEGPGALKRKSGRKQPASGIDSVTDADTPADSPDTATITEDITVADYSPDNSRPSTPALPPAKKFKKGRANEVKQLDKARDGRKKRV